MYISAYYNLRRWVYDLQKRYRRRNHKVVPIPYHEGMPPGIDRDTLDAVCRENFEEPVAEISHQHLSGWKSSGAYRLHIRTPRGREIFLIYKDASYTKDQIPALIDLPVFPGPPEYVIYSQCCGPMADFLPRVYLAQEIIPGCHFHYLLEDLSQNYHHILEYNDTQRAAILLPRLHQALRDWTLETLTDPRGLIRYGRDFSQAIQLYSHVALQGYSQRTDDPDLKNVLRLWPQIAQMHLHPEFFTLQANTLIHGDSNYTNIHLHKTDPQQFKVVDWEWAGFGIPHADLVSLLKSAPEDIERFSYNSYMQMIRPTKASKNVGLTAKQQHRMYQWAHLERGMLDAGFLTAQYLNSSHLPAFSLPKAINQALQRILASYQQLSN